MSKTLELAKDLIARNSVTPADAGCQEMMGQFLQPLGFDVEPMRFGEVDNLWARKGTAEPLLVFAGHTDVVPTGPEQQWRFPPFEPTEHDGYLYGRGAADMKGSLAAMLTACESFLAQHPQHKGSIGFLITSDEEGPAVDGTVKVIEALEARNEKITACVVGEPTSTQHVGDVIKNGRRGSLGAELTVYGVQGHVAYPHLAQNPIHHFAPALQELTAMQWDMGNEFFPPTTFQVSNINGGTGATNVIPGELKLLFNFRFSTETTPEQLQQKVEQVLNHHGIKYQLDWNLSGMPFLTPSGTLVTAATQAVHEVSGRDTELSTSGGTSDGRFIAPTGAQVLELGPCNATIHKIDECVKIQDLDDLSAMYERIMVHMLA
ncbi:MAG: succinyl-diaminopimelate desuccinylase [Gammaproteobacteria bacterium]|nr:succinyl-diaminopimelate desuccinylase [Gammaproteobacteria bacterium]MDH5802811.1 succinyl-diaminopimelate desuccinylase [Gammaproteobacteria bacterium]